MFEATTPLPPRPVTTSPDDTRTQPDPTKPAPAAYLLHNVVAQGGHGEIWQGVQVSLSRQVAVKKVRQKYYNEYGHESLRLLEVAFHKEALVTGRLDHPAIVPIYDIGSDQDGRPLLAMKLIVGREWTDILNEDAALDRSAYLARHLPILISVAQAVAFAHSRAVIHRDLKPSQVMVGQYGEVYLMDWGLAAIFDDLARPAGDAPTLPYSISAREAINPAGTTAYMAPEQTESTGERLGPWTDVWLLGGTLYRLLTETPPYNETTSKAAFDRAKAGLVEPPEMRAPYLDIPPELSRIAMKAMSREIGDRYGSVQEFIKALQDYMQGTNRRAESEQLTENARSLCRASQDYENLSQCDNVLTRALNLWSENTAAAHLQQELLLKFAERALEQGDLGLARLQGGRLANGNAREALLSRIEAEALRLRRLARQRRLALAACFILVLTLGGLGQLLLRNRASAAIRQSRNESENELIQHKAQRTHIEAEEDRLRAETAKRIGDLYASEQQLARDLTREWRQQMQVSPTLAYSPYDAQVLKEKNLADLDALQSRLQEVESLRASLDARSLGSPPSSLEYAAGIMALYRAGAGTDLAKARDYFERAAASGSQRHQAMTSLAVIDFRLGDYDATMRDLDLAGRTALQTVNQTGDYRKVVALAHELGRKRAESFRLGPQDVLIEPRRGGQNYQYYSDTGSWMDVNKPHEWAKSCAPGATLLPPWGSRGVRFFTGVSAQDTSFPSVARYQVKPAERRHLYVYATWPFSANAFPVNYVVHHADGTSTHSLAQDGWSSVMQGNANLWTSLGDYDFLPTDDQGLELRVEANVRPVARENNGQAIADAVLFSTRALDAQTTEPRTELDAPPDSLLWVSNYSQALAKARAEHKPLLVYISSTLSNFLTFSNSHVFNQPEVVKTINSRYVTVQVGPQGNLPENYRFASIPAGTIIVCDSNGSEQRRISPEKGLSAEALLAELAK
jgi:serine/threonine protein kinase